MPFRQCFARSATFQEDVRRKHSHTSQAARCTAFRLREGSKHAITDIGKDLNSQYLLSYNPERQERARISHHQGDRRPARLKGIALALATGGAAGSNNYDIRPASRIAIAPNVTTL